MMYLIANNLKMKSLSAFLGMLCIALGTSSTLWAQAVTAQQKARQQEAAEQGPILFDYDSTYLTAIEEERAEFLEKKTLIDSMDISTSLREKLIRDLYKAKPTKRLTKALLAATIEKEEELTGDPEREQ